MLRRDMLNHNWDMALAKVKSSSSAKGACSNHPNAIEYIKLGCPVKVIGVSSLDWLLRRGLLMGTALPSSLILSIGAHKQTILPLVVLGTGT